jgi:hypothetical protein
MQNTKKSEDWERKVADDIWVKLKGKHVPKEYTIEECRDILKRYWHKAMESEQ